MKPEGKPTGKHKGNLRETTRKPKGTHKGNPRETQLKFKKDIRET